MVRAADLIMAGGDKAEAIDHSQREPSETDDESRRWWIVQTDDSGQKYGEEKGCTGGFVTEARTTVLLI